MRRYLAILTSGLCAYGSAGGADLNAPGRKEVTLGSEIKRGKDAVIALPLTTSIERFMSAYLELVKANQQDRKDSDGFSIGSEYEAWMQIWLILTTVSRGTIDTNYAKDSAEQLFKEFRAKQAEIGLTDDQLAEAIGQKPSFLKASIAAWQNKR